MNKHCLKCGHAWRSNVAAPKKCPKCQQPGGVTNASEQQNADITLHLRSELSRLNAENRDLRKRLGARDEFAAQVGGAVAALEPLKISYKPGRKSQTPIAAVLKLSDWHIGELIDPAQTESFGGFNWSMAQSRAFFLYQKFLDWVGTQRQSYRIDDLYILAEGDWVSGDIHHELQITNEFPLPVQAARAGQLLANIIKAVAPHFKSVHLIEVGGDNHGRLVRKPQAKQKASNNMGFVVYTLTNSYLERHANVEIVQPEGMKTVVNMGGKRVLTEHGDTIKSWMGIPYYGMERTRNRELYRRFKRDLGFDYWSIGHFHVPAVVSGDMLVNGSLSGTSEFDHSLGRHSPPTQVSFLMHPKHGLFNWVPWRLDNVS